MFEDQTNFGHSFDGPLTVLAVKVCGATWKYGDQIARRCVEKGNKAKACSVLVIHSSSYALNMRKVVEPERVQRFMQV